MYERRRGYLEFNYTSNSRSSVFFNSAMRVILERREQSVVVGKGNALQQRTFPKRAITDGAQGTGQTNVLQRLTSPKHIGADDLRPGMIIKTIGRIGNDLNQGAFALLEGLHVLDGQPLVMGQFFKLVGYAVPKEMETATGGIPAIITGGIGHNVSIREVEMRQCASPRGTIGGQDAARHLTQEADVAAIEGTRHAQAADVETLDGVQEGRQLPCLGTMDRVPTLFDGRWGCDVQDIVEEV